MLFLQRPARLTFPAALGALTLAGVLAFPTHTLLAQAVTSGEYSLENKGLVATGSLPATARDKFGETTISASGMAMSRNAWWRTEHGYGGVLYLLPDRGYNVTGTIDYQPRIHKLRSLQPPSHRRLGKYVAMGSLRGSSTRSN
jgi:hypothetical protein